MNAGREAAARIGPVGVWLGVLGESTAQSSAAAAADIERLGYGALWVGESPVHKEVFTHAALLLSATSRLTVATGVATIWARDAVATNAATQTLGEAFPDRFVLGLGVSHVEAGRGAGHNRPRNALRQYLESFDVSPYEGPYPVRPVPRVLAAMGPRMQELARDRADGVHSFFVPPSHTAAARERLGDGPLLVPEQAVVLEPDRGRARAIAREHVATRIRLRNYVNHMRAMGFEDDDLSGGGSDRLVDALIGWGDARRVAVRVREHLDAGADHVAIHPLTEKGRGLESVLDQLRELAPALLTGRPTGSPEGAPPHE